MTLAHIPQIKMIKLALVVLAVMGALAYAQTLRIANRELKAQNLQLAIINVENQRTIDELRRVDALKNDILTKWETEKTEINAVRREVASNVQKTMQNDEVFNKWGNSPLPVNINELLGHADAGKGTNPIY